MEELQAALIRLGAGRSVPRTCHSGPLSSGQNLTEQLSSGDWVERAPYFEAVAARGTVVFDTLNAVSKMVLKALA